MSNSLFRNKALELVFLFISLVVFDWLIFKFLMFFGHKLILYISDYLVKFIILFLLLMTVFYRKSLPKPRIGFLLLITFPFAFFIAYKLVNVNKLYVTLVEQKKYFSTGIWMDDQDFGHVGVPFANGFYGARLSDSLDWKIPVLLDDKGFRVGEAETEMDSSKSAIFLGCSYTFGDFLPAEETYAFLTSKALGLEYDNTAASAYGLVQMYLRAKELIPTNNYTYVFIQYSPWLVDRAVSFTAPTFSGYKPSPYFSKMDEGGFEVQPVAFNSSYKGNEIDVNAYKNKVYSEKLSFTREIGIPVEFKDSFRLNWAKLMVSLGKVPKPTDQKNDLELFVFQEIIDLAKNNGSSPIILCLDCNKNSPMIKALTPEVAFIDLSYPIQKATLGSKENKKKQFQIHAFNGLDTVWVDGHPNAKAHRLFTQEIITHLNLY